MPLLILLFFLSNSFCLNSGSFEYGAPLRDSLKSPIPSPKAAKNSNDLLLSITSGSQLEAVSTLPQIIRRINTVVNTSKNGEWIHVVDELIKAISNRLRKPQTADNPIRSTDLNVIQPTNNAGRDKTANYNLLETKSDHFVNKISKRSAIWQDSNNIQGHQNNDRVSVDFKSFLRSLTLDTSEKLDKSKRSSTHLDKIRIPHVHQGNYLQDNRNKMSFHKRGHILVHDVGDGKDNLHSSRDGYSDNLHSNLQGHANDNLEDPANDKLHRPVKGNLHNPLNRRGIHSLDRARGNMKTRFDGSHLNRRGNPHYDLRGNPYLNQRDSPRSNQRDSPRLNQDGNPHLNQRDSPSLDPRGNPHLDPPGNPHLNQLDNPRLTHPGNSLGIPHENHQPNDRLQIFEGILGELDKIQDGRGHFENVPHPKKIPLDNFITVEKNGHLEFLKGNDGHFVHGLNRDKNIPIDQRPPVLRENMKGIDVKEQGGMGPGRDGKDHHKHGIHGIDIDQLNLRQLHSLLDYLRHLKETNGKTTFNPKLNELCCPIG